MIKRNPKRGIRSPRTFLLFLVLFILAGAALSQVPSINQRLSWRKEVVLAYVGGILHPAGPVPTARPQQTPAALAPGTHPTAAPSATAIPPTFTPTPGPTATPVPSPTPLPASVSLPAPEWEKQDMNNCGPATLSMYLDTFGWEGDQFTVSEVIKPVREDRNVNVEELVYYVRNFAGWLRAEFRVGGDLNLLKQLLAAGIPVMVEESFYFDEPFWPNDDLWAAHYQLLTGYDDASQTFTGQDSFHGPDLKISYEALDKEWQVFNRVFILIYLPEQEPALKAILGEHWNADTNRQLALETAEAESKANPENAYAWFNLGSNLVYFERYAEAALAYDTARSLGLPQRMLRYQFGPFLAYFHESRNEDLLVLTEYALQRTANAEEALLWHGWALYRMGENSKAIQEFRAALESNPNYLDARYALEFLGAAP